MCNCLLERLMYAIFLAAPPPWQHIPVTAGTIIYPLIPYYYNTRLYRQPRRLQYMYKIILYSTRACYRKPLCLRRSGAETRTKLCTLLGAFRAL